MPEHFETVAPEPFEVEVGGAILELPAGATEETVKLAVENFRASPSFDKLVDKSRGAPARVRALVGGAPLQDRLANLKRFFPDAFAFGEDNFVFTDPETGNPTLYNPEGFDVGDVASVGREVSEAVGGTLGATFGAAGGFVLGSPTGPGVALTTVEGGILGAGLGTAAGGSLFDITMNMLAGRIDTRNPLEATLDTAIDFLAGAGGQKAGEVVQQGVKAALGGGKAAAQGMAEAFARLRIDPPAGAVTGSRTLGTIEKSLESTPSATAIMQRQAEKVLEQTKAAADSLAAKFGPLKTTAEAGATIKSAAVSAAERFGFKQEQVYQEAFDLVGAETRVAVPAVTELRHALTAELAGAPESLKSTLNPALNMVRQIQADAAEGGVAFDALRQIRTNIGKDIAAPQLSGSTGAQNEALKRIYGALTEDMSAAAKEAGPEAAKKLAVADRFTRAWMNTTNKTLQKIVKFETDERAFNFVMSSTKDGANQLARLQRNFTAEEWDTVAGTVLGRMGLARPTAQNVAGDAFSVSTFLTNWNRITPEAKKVLFGGKRYKDLSPALDDLVNAVSSLKGVEKLTNTSNTSRNMIAWMTIQSLVGGSGGLAAGGGAQSVGAGVLGALIAPNLTARLITSPAFVRWLITPVTKVNGILPHLGRLVAIGEAEPDLREGIAQYVAAMRSVERADIEE